VRFVRVDHLVMPKRTLLEPSLSSERRIEVVLPGGFTTVQDLGRPGYEAFGVSPGGAADRASLRLANLAVGNDEGAPALEICASGPVLRFHAVAVVAFVDGAGKPRRVAAGELMDLSRLANGVRAYLAVAGGLVVPQVLGSSATDPGAGFGGHHGRALQTGDVLEFGKAGRAPTGGHWHLGRAGRSSQIELRFLAGVQQGWFSKQALRRFRSAVYQVTPRSDRMGTRLSGESLMLETPREMVSQPVACGSVQVPPDGQPIVLLAGRQTIGGYPQIGHVISTDLPKLARAWPGTRVTFREVTWEEARDLRRQEEQDFARLRNGLELLKSPTCTSSI
jgi:antagonist of KipI